VLDRQALTKRTQKVGSDSESLSSDGDEDMSDDALRQKAVKDMKDLIDDDEEAESEQSDSDNDGVIKMDFSE